MAVKNYGDQNGKNAPSKPAARPGKGGKSGYDSEFVNYTLTEQERSHVKSLWAGPSDGDNAIIRLIEQGYSLSVSWDAFSSCFMCIIRPKGDPAPNAGFLLSGRGSTPLKAIRQAWYIHEFVFEHDWAAHFTRQSATEIDD